jgi:uncharacterized protein YigE (DUF2233 family)
LEKLNPVQVNNALGQEMRFASTLRCLAVLLCLPIAEAGAATSTRDRPVLHRFEISVYSRRTGLSMVVFAQAYFTFVVIDNSVGDRPRFDDVRDAMLASGCIAGTNGGFFVKDRWEPSGLVVTRGHRSGSFDAKSWMNGILVVRQGQIAFESSEVFVLDHSVAEAIQTGPFLIRGGKIEPALDNGRVASRTFACTDGFGNWGLGVSTPCALSELAVALASEKVGAALEVSSALNLDGGPSTGLWSIANDTEVHLPQRWPVKNFVGITRRSSLSKPESSVPP